MSQPQPDARFDLSGGNLALDFANTVSNRPAENRTERLAEYQNLVAFGRETGALPVRAVDRLYAVAGEAPGQGKSILHGAIQLREAIFDIFSAVAERRTIPVRSLALLNIALQKSAPHGRIVHTSRRFVWEWIGMDCYLDSILWPVARAAADLLTSEDIAKVRICASDKCAWLFLDQTKNHRRRWCDMKTCGNRVKAQRHYQRVKSI
ncbi:MAG TPA: ABATE domain-containing protein [Terriglobales bacterium]|nr:ABATE domain-containing protein [Terriglobales bacterium]